MKKNILALSVSAVLSCPAYADILITEYIDGGSNNKAIEIANTGTDTLTLTGYTIEKDTNGKGLWDYKLALNDITLFSNQTYVFVHQSADSELKQHADTCSNELTSFNGDDPIAIKKDGNIVDIVGVPGRVNLLDDSSIRRRVFTPSTKYDAGKFDDLADPKDFSGLGNLDPVPAVPKPAATPASIQEIQGTGWSSTIGGIDVPNGKYDSGDNYFEVTGVITAIQEFSLKKGLPQGFTMQAGEDGNDLTSDGIVVETKKISGLKLGTQVTVIAKVKEDYGLTKLFSVYSVTENGAGNLPQVTPVRTIASDVDDSGNPDFDKTLERHEGMLVTFDKDADMHVTRTFGFDHGPKRNNMVMSHKGINQHPNQSNIPGSDKAKAQRQSNQNRRVVVESFSKAPDGKIPWYPDFAQASAVPMNNGTTTSDDYIRIGDKVNGLEGVISYHYNDFHLYVTNKVTGEAFTHNLPRTEAPVIDKSGLRIGTMNVLNYFNSPFGGDCNPLPPGSRDSVANTGCNNRGAATQEEFELQGDKIAAAIVAMDADILGLMEIENNGFDEDSAVAHLVDKINLLIPNRVNHYVYVKSSGDDKFVGSDAIANQVIYRPSKVHLDEYRLIQMPRQEAGETKSSDGKKKEDGKNYQRDAITPTFIIKGTKPEQKLTVSVNHFKSKGSTCWEDVDPSEQDGQDPDHQGSCENFRVSAAQHLGTVLSESDNADSTIILGDLNSYGSEDPMLLLTTLPEGYSVTPAKSTYVGDQVMNGQIPQPLSTSFGYINVLKEKHPDSFSYSYNDEVGTLDYILVSPKLKERIKGAAKWNINATESSLFQYSGKYTGDLEKFKDMYRSSDHDPAMITLDLGTTSVANRTPVQPPKEPQSPPANVQAIPQKAVTGGAIQVLFDLTNLNIDLHVSDKATVSFGNFTAYSAADTQVPGDTATVVLDQAMIEQGWTVVEMEVSQAGKYQMTKSVIDGATNEVSYLSYPETVTISEPAGKKKSGGSLGGFVLLSLFGAGILRRRKQ
ncbi:ExeM/NucH family extracellular endonuclease [Vibrio sp. JC009]|uniref:ExeM/NucH family extracellular endonuclease n=1 Tax=Vibrio sp. JC009 TaxID=2912314 RepID=UPI0023AF5B81|nr:ExeM/NucH family extracellular endonuclease [Vibrio sp. JC009]WED24769.1 ExeM/NucH family extracellular endonuclease [Vibrio sp. JC009]